MLGSFLVGVIPFLVIALVPVIAHGYRVVFFHLSRPDLGILGYGRSVFTASPMLSYYGPLGLVLLLSPIAILMARRSARDPIVALAAAPLLFLMVLTLTIEYGVFNGRFFAFAMAFAAASAMEMGESLTLLSEAIRGLDEEIRRFRVRG